MAGRYRVALYPGADGAVAQVAVGDAVVEATGLALPVSWAGATVGGVELPDCAEVADTSCNDGETLIVRGGDVTVLAGGATVTVTGAVPEVRIGVGRAAWGDLAEPTPLTDLDPDIPPPCLAAP
jgi:hypothetical protein